MNDSSLAASSLRSDLRDRGCPGLLSVGVRASATGSARSDIIVYVAQSTARVRERIPATWRGFLVHVEALRPASTPPDSSGASTEH